MIEPGDQVLIHTDRDGCQDLDGLIGTVMKPCPGDVLYGKVMKEPEEDLWDVEVCREGVKGHYTLHSLYVWELTEVRNA